MNGFAKELNTAEEVIAELQKAVDSEERQAVMLWPFEQFGIPETAPSLEAYLAAEERGKLAVYGLKNEWWSIGEKVCAKLVLDYRAVNDFERRGRHPEGISVNGKLIEAKLFQTTINGLRLQVIHFEEWWQAFGGGHIGDDKRLWLVNQAPLKLAF